MNDALKDVMRDLSLPIVQEAVREELDRHFTAERPRSRLRTRPKVLVELGISAPTLRKLRREGCPSVLVGTQTRFEVDAALAWIRARSANAEAAG